MKKTSPQQKQPEQDILCPTVLELRKRWPLFHDTFEQFCDILLALRASLYSSEWDQEHPDPRPPLGGDPSQWTYDDLQEYNRGYSPRHSPGHAPDSEWGKVHLERAPRRGKTSWLDLLREVWEHLDTPEHRARTLLLLEAAYNEACRRREAGQKKWEARRKELKHRDKALKQARTRVEASGEALLQALEEHRAATQAVAPYARNRLDFPHSPAAQKRVILAECDNPGEIGLCIEEVRHALERFRAVEDYRPFPTEAGATGHPEYKALNTAIRELERMLLPRLMTNHRTLKHIHCLLFVAGLWPKPSLDSLTGKLYQLRRHSSLE